MAVVEHQLFAFECGDPAPTHGYDNGEKIGNNPEHCSKPTNRKENTCGGNPNAILIAVNELANLSRDPYRVRYCFP